MSYRLLIWALLTTFLGVVGLNAPHAQDYVWKTVPTVAPSYTGPVDVIPSAAACYSLRACTAAYATGSNPAIEIKDTGGGNTLVVNITSAGDLDTAAVSAWIALHGTARVSKLYDQISTQHVTQTQAFNRPDLVPSGFGSRSVIRFNAAGVTTLDGTLAVSQSQSFSISAIAKQNTTGSGVAQAILGTSSPTFAVLEFSVTSGNVRQYFGSIGTNVSASNNAMHAIQSLAAGAGSKLQVDGGAPSTTNPNTGALGTDLSLGSWPGVGEILDGDICEVIIWAGDKSASFSALHTNQSTYWGTP